MDISKMKKTTKKVNPVASKVSVVKTGAVARSKATSAKKVAKMMNGMNGGKKGKC